MMKTAETKCPRPIPTKRPLAVKYLSGLDDGPVWPIAGDDDDVIRQLPPDVADEIIHNHYDY